PIQGHAGRRCFARVPVLLDQVRHSDFRVIDYRRAYATHQAQGAAVRQGSSSRASGNESIRQLGFAVDGTSSSAEADQR
ncbi:hypothetical protein ABTD49_21865, partial [Acinetobacter baumannii]